MAIHGETYDAKETLTCEGTHNLGSFREKTTYDLETSGVKETSTCEETHNLATFREKPTSIEEPSPCVETYEETLLGEDVVCINQ